MAPPAPPRYLVNPPDTSVQPVRFGILSAAILIEDGIPDHLLGNGAEWEPMSCGIASVTANDCPPWDDPTAMVDIPAKIFDSGDPGTATALPFTVYAPYRCALLGRDITEARARARHRLEYGEERAVEQAISRSNLGNAPLLESTDAQDLTPDSGAISTLAGFTVIEDYLARCSGGRGVIHVTRGLVPSLGNGSLVHHDMSGSTPRLRTFLGTPVVAGAGYDFNGPDGTPAEPGEAWIYVTSPVVVWRGPVFETPPVGREWEGVDRATNDIYALAERNYVVGWDSCCHAAVRVKVGCCC